MASATELALNYESVPLSKRLAMKGTMGMTKNLKIEDEIPDAWKDAIDIVDPQTGLTPLLISCFHGTINAVRIVISRGANLNYKETNHGFSPLILASKNGHVEIVEELLHRGAIINITDNKERTALMHASKNGHFGAVLILLKFGLGINLIDVSGWSALHFAAKFGHKDIADYLINAGAILGLKENIEGKTPLMLASQFGRKETAGILIDNGAFINAVSDVDGVTALMVATKEGHKGTVSLLLSRQADSNLYDKYGWTALHFAASWGRKEIAAILISEGKATIDIQPPSKQGDGGTTPLIIATKAQQVDVIRVLLNLGGNIDIIDTKEGKAALSYAAKLGLEESVRCLLDFNASVNIREVVLGATPLMLAGSMGYETIVKMLLDSFADLNYLDANVKSAFDYADEGGHRDLFLDCIAGCGAIAKANAIPWIEMALPKMDRSSKKGGPTVFLNSVLYGETGLYSGLLQRTEDADVYLTYSLAMIYSGCHSASALHPFDRYDLRRKMDQISEMVKHIMHARSFSANGNLEDVLLLTPAQDRIGDFNTRQLMRAFVSGPLALAIDSGLTELLVNHQIKAQLNAVFLTCFQAPGKLVNGYGGRTPLLRLRYCPAFMFVWEGFSRVFLLLLVIVNCCPEYTNGSSILSRSFAGYSLISIVLVIMFICFSFYEYGLIEEKRWMVSPSIVFFLKHLELKRWRRVNDHFFEDVWKFCDFSTLLLLVCWIILHFTSKDDAIVPLSLSAIPLSVGLLRYPSAFSQPFGRGLLTIFAMTLTLWPFALMFAVSGLGFGIVFYSLFRHDIQDFSSIRDCINTLVITAFTNFDLKIFDGTKFSSFGNALLIVFAIWIVAILFILMVGNVMSNYAEVYDKSNKEWALIKAKTIQCYLLSMEKSPAAMLPPPFNIIPLIVYIPHVFISWRSRLNRSQKLCVSVAGTLCDRILALSMLLPSTICECVIVLSEPNRMLDIFFFPVSFLFCLISIFFKIVLDPFTRLIVKSRLQDGRLRISYGDDRDSVECIGYVDKLSMNKGDPVSPEETKIRMLTSKNVSRVPEKKLLKLNSNFGHDVRIAPSAGLLSPSFDKNQSLKYSVGANIDGNIDEDKDYSIGNISKTVAEIGAHSIMNNAPDDLTNGLYFDDLSVSSQQKIETPGDFKKNLNSVSPLMLKALSKSGRKKLPNVSICFPPFKFGKLFLPHERRLIFQNVLPEYFDDAANNSTDLIQILLGEIKAGILHRIDELEKQQDMQVQFSQRILNQVTGSAGKTPSKKW